jgi:hypothetical protein
MWSQFPSSPDWTKELPAALLHMDNWRIDVLAKGTLTPCILSALTSVDGPGAGVGAQLGSDLLYRLGIHPFCPALTICQSDVQFNTLRDYLPVFMARWIAPKFLRECCSNPNSLNPFAFNYAADKKFISSSVDVFRRVEVRVPVELYNTYLQQGLLDEDHTIGTLFEFNLFS